MKKHILILLIFGLVGCSDTTSDPESLPLSTYDSSSSGDSTGAPDEDSGRSQSGLIGDSGEPTRTDVLSSATGDSLDSNDAEWVDDVGGMPDVSTEPDVSSELDVTEPQDISIDGQEGPEDGESAEDIEDAPDADDGASVDTESDAEMDAAEGSEAVGDSNIEESSDAFLEADTNAEQDVLEEGDVSEETDTPEPVSSACEEACADGTFCTNGTCSTAICGVEGFDTVVTENAALLASELLISQLPDLSWAPSQIYTWPDLLQGLATSCNPGFAGFSFWTGAPDSSADNRTKATLINLAAFLAQSMKETIQYDACDENNWDNTNGYKISNSCGQLGQNYEDYDCAMACPKDPTMQMTAVTNAKWYGAPGPMFCAPDSVLIDAGLSTDGSTGYWNYNTDCWPYPATEQGFLPLNIDAWLRPECEVYPGQKGGRWEWDGSGGSVEGCCWWGRGVIQTTGRCNFGTLNHYLGNTHLDPSEFAPPASVPYPDLDFCANPNVICESPDYPELKWIAGLFYWMSSVQEYDMEGWDYETELQAYIDGGLNGFSFIDAVSGIVNRGCHNPPCATGAVDGLSDRRANFTKALEAMGLL